MNKLLQPYLLGSLSVKNRFVRSATHDRMGNLDGTISSRELDMYEALAKNDIGLIISGHSYVQHPYGRVRVNQNAIYADRYIEGYQRIAEILHRYGTRFVVQISHAGSLTTGFDAVEGQTPVGPSAIKVPGSIAVPRELTEQEIEEIIDDFLKAAQRVQQAGCDGVQIHGAHGYLIAQFLSPYTNQRTDKWGGSIANRSRLLQRIVKGIRNCAGDKFPLLVKLDCVDPYSGPEYLQDVIYTAKVLKEIGVTALEISGGNWPECENEDYYIKEAEAIKKNMDIPVILVGGLRQFEKMEAYINEQRIDMVSLSRPFICEPDLIRRFQNGQEKSSCRSCNYCRQKVYELHCFLNINKKTNQQKEGSYTC